MRIHIFLTTIFLGTVSLHAHPLMLPRISGDWIEIATDPDLGDLTSSRQQPVDFAIWQAADGTWQLWSCIRATKAPGKTRLFHAWESPDLTKPNWKPKGIAMQADPQYGETPGGLQAPHVIKIPGGTSDTSPVFHMFYGDWENICAATSADGKHFDRRLNDKKAGMFTEGQGNNTRDPIVLNINGKWHCYYTAYSNKLGAVYCRTSSDTRQWSDSKIVAFGGDAGTNAVSSECPFVVELTPGEFYLFRTQRYGANAISRIYHSHDPMNFGINEDSKYLVGSLPVAAPELILHYRRGPVLTREWYIAALAPSLKGIRLAKLDWTKK